MKYFIPKLERAKEFNSQFEIKEKLGGLPFGLPAAKYPLCQRCKNPMALLAQFIHDNERLNLGGEGRILFIFQCSNDGFCSTWEADSGANACFILGVKDLTNQVENLPDGKIELEKEYWITGWQEFDDGVSLEDSLVFFDADKYSDLEEEDFEQMIEKVTEDTRLGGAPFWIQYPEIPEGNWKFIGQLNDITGFNFGDAGIGYIFIEETENPSQLPKGKFLWQCG